MTYFSQIDQGVFHPPRPFEVGRGTAESYFKTGQDTGRCKGGIAQLSHKSLAVKKDRIKTNGWRIQGQIFNFPSRKLLWVNIYLPTDPRTENWDDTELQLYLSEMKSIIDASNTHLILVSGDLNWEMTRNTKFSKIVHDFLLSVNLESVWKNIDVDFIDMHTCL